MYGKDRQYYYIHLPIKERLGFGTSEFTVVPDEFSPATLRLAPGSPDDTESQDSEPE